MAPINQADWSPNDWPEWLPELRIIDNLLRCSVCYEYFDTAVLFQDCSHNYCSLCIRNSMMHNPQCPTCFEKTSSNDLKCNRVLDELVKNFVEVRSKLLDIIKKASLQSDDVLEKKNNIEMSDDSASNFEVTPRRLRMSLKTRLKTKKGKSPCLTPRNKRKRTKIINSDSDDSDDEDTVEPQTMEIDPVKSPASTSQPTDDGEAPTSFVECPVCQELISSNINRHLDLCLISREKKSSLRSRRKATNMKSGQNPVAGSSYDKMTKKIPSANTYMFGRNRFDCYPDILIKKQESLIDFLGELLKKVVDRVPKPQIKTFLVSGKTNIAFRINCMKEVCKKEQIEYKGMKGLSRDIKSYNLGKYGPQRFYSPEKKMWALKQCIMVKKEVFPKEVLLKLDDVCHKSPAAKKRTKENRKKEKKERKEKEKGLPESNKRKRKLFERKRNEYSACNLCNKREEKAMVMVRCTKCNQWKCCTCNDICKYSGQKRKTIPRIVYAILSDKQLKQKLKQWNLSTQGDRKKLIKRHQDFVVAYNAQCDSLNPKPVSAIVKELESREKRKTTELLSATSTGPNLNLNRDASEEQVDKVHKQYLQENKGQFEKLIEEIKKRKEQRGKSDDKSTKSIVIIDDDSKQDDRNESENMDQQEAENDSSEDVVVPSLRSLLEIGLDSSMKIRIEKQNVPCKSSPVENSPQTDTKDREDQNDQQLQTNDSRNPNDSEPSSEESSRQDEISSASQGTKKSAKKVPDPPLMSNLASINESDNSSNEDDKDDTDDDGNETKDDIKNDQDWELSPSFEIANSDEECNENVESDEDLFSTTPRFQTKTISLRRKKK